MSISNPFLWPKPSIPVSYGIAVLSVAAALAIGQWPPLHLQDAPVSLFLCAIMVSAWFGGIRPAALAILLAVLAFNYFNLPPIFAFGLKGEELPRFAVFAFSAILVGSLSDAQRSAAESLRQGRDALAATGQELKRINAALHDENAGRKRTEEALRRSEAYLTEAQRISHTGSFGWNVSSAELFCSDETRRIVEFDRGAKPAIEHLLQRTHPEDLVFAQETFDRAGREGSDLDLKYRLLMPDGCVKHVHVVAHTAKDESGGLEFVGALMDVTAQHQARAALEKALDDLHAEIAERKRAADALDVAQAELAHVTRVMTIGELVASIAHEVNQPLGAIVTNGQACLRLLSREPPGVDKSRAVIERIVGDGMRASEVIKRIRALLKKTTPGAALLSINETIQEVVAMAAGEAQRSKVRLLTELAGDLPPVVGDRVQLQQVILNLILNGRDAMKAVEREPRELLIRSVKTGSDEVLVAVRDSGVGFDPQEAERLFDPFFTTKSEGMGLGLSISRTIIEAHGGRLWAAPNQGRGATVQFTLPAGREICS